MTDWCATKNFNETIDRQVLESNDFGVEPDDTKEVLVETASCTPPSRPRRRSRWLGDVCRRDRMVAVDDFKFEVDPFVHPASGRTNSSARGEES